MDPGQCLALACRGGEALLLQRTPTTMGMRFPSVEDAEARDKYGVGLYDGAAGVGIVLLDLAHATGDRRFRRLDDRVEEGLVESTPADGALGPGLFDGYSGIALHHLARARQLNDHDAFRRAMELGVRLATAPLSATDLISGAAGTGLLQLALYHASAEEVFLDGARRIYQFLAETATTDGNTGCVWPAHDPRQPVPTESSAEYLQNAARHFTGLAHGSAGICVFLLEYAAVAKDPDAVHLYEQGFRWLDARAVQCNGGLCWPRSDADPGLQAHWCHGSAGIAHAYLALHRETGRAEALAHALAAAELTWLSASHHPDEPAFHCHGLSGAIELFVTVAMHTGDQEWLGRAGGLASRIAARADASPLDPGPHSHSNMGPPATFGARGAGFSVGTAGVMRELLRLGGWPVSPVLVPVRARLRLLPRRWATSTMRRPAPPHHLPQTASTPWMRDLLPPVAVPLARKDRWLVLGAPDDRAARTALRLLAEHAAGAAYFAALSRITVACRELTNRHAGLVSSGALTPASFGLLLREIAGICLAPGSDVHRVAPAAERMTTHAIDAVGLLLRRVAVDRRPGRALAREVGGALREITIIGGDSHRRGQKVVLLRFDSGPTLVYKARCVATDRELAGISREGECPTLVERCNSWLEPSIPGGRLPTHRLIAASDSYGYAEHVSASHLDSIEPALRPTLPVSELGYVLPELRVAALRAGDERRFWYTAGLLAGFAFSVGAHDLHAENVVCGTSASSPDLSPHLVDAELAFGRVNALSDTQLVPRPRRPGSESSTHNHCGLTMSLELDCGLHAEEWVLALGPDGIQSEARVHQGAAWRFPHIVRNPDGTFGFGSQLCAFVRGIADEWQLLRERSDDVATHLRSALAGRPARVLRKATQSYLAALERRKMGGAPVLGAAYVTTLFAGRLDRSELRQLDALDFPYYVRFLGEEQDGRPGLWWMSGRRGRLAPGPSLESVPASPPLPFWSIADRQCDPPRLARALADAVLCAVPEGPFDLHDPSSGVRVVRTQEDARILIAVLLGPRRGERLTCRVAQDDGVLEWWMD